MLPKTQNGYSLLAFTIVLLRQIENINLAWDYATASAPKRPILNISVMLLAER